jgi:two-component system NtrC family sensor kinase
LYLNIRQKVILGFTACVLAIGFIGGFSYHYLHAIELKQHVVQIADDLREIVLEIRRYEKNYLLYGQEEEFKQNQVYTQKALELLATIIADIKNLKVASQMDTFKKDLIDYQGLMKQLANPGSGAIPTAGPWKTSCGPRGRAWLISRCSWWPSSAYGFWKSSPP